MKDLNKLKNSLENYEKKFQERLIEIREIKFKNEDISYLNNRNKQENERFKDEVNTKGIIPVEKQIEEIKSQLRENEVGRVTSFFQGQETVDIGGYRIPVNEEGRLRYEYNKITDLTNKLTNYKKKIADTWVRWRKSIKEQLAVPPQVRPSTNLVFLGTKYIVYYEKFKIEDLDKRIARITVEKNKQKKESADKDTKYKETMDNLKARAAVNEAETRSEANKYRQDFQTQTKIDKMCPYCGTHLNKSGAHNDHIYPVAKGGKSSRKNLVFVCSKCNRKKGKLTLNSFIEKLQYDRELIYSRLKKLGKEF